MDPVQKAYFRQSWTQWWKSLILIIQWEWKGTLRRNLAVNRRDEKKLFFCTKCKTNKQKKKTQKNERKNYIMGYEYALLENQKNRHTNCTRGRDHNADYRRANGKEIKRWSCCSSSNNMVSASGSKPFLCQLFLRREIKEDAVHHPGQREDDGRARILFLRPDEI